MATGAEPETAVRLDRPPPAFAIARLPTSFGRRFLMTVDTEEEFDWSQPFRRDAVATRAIAALPALHDELVGRGAHPAYLVDHPVAADPAAVATLARVAEGGAATIGAQLHPWVTPPFEEAVTRVNSFAGNLEAALEAAKIAMITARITAAFGRTPTMFRAGRYGVGPATAAALVTQGYRLDSSVRPYFNYAREGGPDFLRHPTAPYWAGPGAALLELPLGSGFAGPLRRRGAALYAALDPVPRGHGLLARTGLLTRIGFTPEGFAADDAIAAIGASLDAGARTITLSLHSTSAAPGHTPYVRDAGDRLALSVWLERVLAFLAREGVSAASPEALVDAAWSARG